MGPCLLLPQGHRPAAASAGVQLSAVLFIVEQAASPACHGPRLATQSVHTLLKCSVLPLNFRVCRVLPLNQICAGSIRAINLMVADWRGAADVAGSAAAVAAAAAAACNGSGGSLDVAKPVPPAALALQLDSEAAGAGIGSAPGKLPPPAVVTVRRHSAGRQQGSRLEGSGSGWMRAGNTNTAAGGDSPRWGQDVELSAASGLPTPSTARPLSPDPSDAFASA